MRPSPAALLLAVVGLAACAGSVAPASASPTTEACGTVTSVRGVVDLGTGPAVRRARPGTSVSPPASLFTRDAGGVSLVTAGREASVTAGPSTSLQLARGACDAGPSMTLASGSVKVATGRATTSELRTRVARVQGRAATWTTTIGAGKVTVTVTKGSVTVQGAAGTPVRVRAGSTTVVAGRAEPSRPTR